MANNGSAESASSGVPRNCERYEYMALEPGWIRVLYLKPGVFGSPLYAELEHVIVPQSSKRLRPARSPASSQTWNCPMADFQDGYEAISYAWGDPVFPHCLHMDGNRQVRITDSLHSALQHFRCLDRDRRLWADAVCIDQSNLGETAAQVAIMSKVFANAKRVLVWLGQSKPEDALAFRFIIDTKRFQEVDGGIYGASMSYSGLEICECCGDSFDTPSDGIVSGLLASMTLLHRPWFSRVWVVPEVLCTRRANVYLCSGFHRARLNDFVHATVGAESILQRELRNVILADAWNIDLRRTLELLVDCRWLFFRESGDWNTHSTREPLDLIAHATSRSCTKDQDRVFSLWSLLELDTSRDTDVDYTQTLVETYRRFVVGCSWRATGRPTLATFLALIGTEMHDEWEDSHPSWVPQLHQLTKRSTMKIYMYNHRFDRSNWQTQWTSHGESAPYNSYWKMDMENRNHLRIKGKTFAEITTTLPDSEYPPAPSTEADVEKLIDWYLACRAFVGDCLDEADLDRLLLRILSSGTTERERTSINNDNYLYVHAFRKFKALLDDKPYNMRSSNLRNDKNSIPARNEGDVEPAQEPEIEDVIAPDDISFLIHTLLGGIDPNFDTGQILSRLSGNGFETIARVPQSAQAGDVLFAFFGAPYPIVLRETLDGYFRVIGNAFAWKVSLQQALGGSAVPDWDGIKRGDRTDRSLLSFLDWSSEDEQMQQLFSNLDWITLE